MVKTFAQCPHLECSPLIREFTVFLIKHETVATFTIIFIFIYIY